MAVFPSRSGFGAKEMLITDSESSKTLGLTPPKQLKAEFKCSNFSRIRFRVLQLSAAITGCPTGVEFKLFVRC